MITKACVACKAELPATLEFFYARGKDKLRGRCKGCNTDKQDPVYARVRALKRKYGLSLEEFEAMLVSQGGGCAICGGTNPHGKSLCVDHDHATGEVRGLLCDGCNKSLGLMGDDTCRLRRAISYLEAER